METPGEQAFKTTGRFSLERLLGSGSFGDVYQAYDRERNARVALKTLRLVDPAGLYRFKAEFRALADIVHPNLATLYELVSDGEHWFFTMELVDGVDFLRYVRGIDSGATPTRDECPTSAEASDVWGHVPAGTETRDSGFVVPAPPPRVDLLRSALRQLAEGLRALHDAGKLHRDLKPSNVLVTSPGRVVILDFGLVAEVESGSVEASLTPVGTPAYMSPEQAAGLALSEASDWYCVGVMLYEALTGQRPFSGKYAALLLEEPKLRPPAPRDAVPGLPDDLDALCRALLERDPRARPSGREVVRRMDEIGPSDAMRGGAEAEAPRTAPFVGRERHMKFLMDSLEATRTGRAVAICLHGASGIGKSALVRHFLLQVRRSREVVVLAGRCYERESVPYKALDSLMDALSQYLTRLPELRAEALLPRDVLALTRLFPVLGRVEAVARARRGVLDIPDSQELRRRAFSALRELLARLADRVSLVLVVDDLQWGDVDSAVLLGEVLRPPDPPHLLLVACHRGEEWEQSPVFRTLAALGGAGGCEIRELALGQLRAQEAHEMALELLGSVEGSAAELAEAIARESGGNPFFIDELARHVQARAQIARATQATLEEVIHSRVSRLPHDARHLLEVAAVAGRPVALEVAERAAALGEGKVSALAQLGAEHMVRIAGAANSKTIETYHDRIREAVLRRLSPEALAARHRYLALALEASGRADPETLTAHFAEAGEREKAAEYAAAAAEEAGRALAFDRSARLYQLALDLRPAYDRALGRLRVGLADALASAGRGAEAGRVYLAAAREETEAEALELRRRAAEQFLLSGHIDEGLAVLRVVLGTLGMTLPRTPRRAMLELVARRAQLRLRGLAFRERSATEIPEHELTRIDACWSVARGLSLVDTIRGACFQTRHLQLALRAGEPYRVAVALAMEAGYVSTGGGRTRRRTERLVSEARTLAERVGNPHAMGVASGVAGLAAFMSGRWKEARELCERSARILRDLCAGAIWEMFTAHIYSLRSLYFLGELAEISRRLPGLLSEAQERGDLYADTYLRTRVSYLLALAEGAPERGRRELRSGIERWSHQGFHLQHYFDLTGQVEIDLYLGDGGVAWERLMERWLALRRSLILRVQVARIESSYLRARTAIAAAAACSGARRERLLREADRDAGRIERERMGWGEPLGRLVRGGIASVRGATDEASRWLASAEHGFEAADMRLHATVARRARGRTIGGAEGRDLVEAADAWLAGQRIAAPDRFSAILASGAWE